MAAQREVFGARFQNPILLAAGTAGYGRELDGVMDLTRLGGLITKAVSLAPRAGNAPPRVAEYPGGMLNSVGLANPGLEAVRRDHLPWLVAHAPPARVIVNVVGFEIAEYAAVIDGLGGIDGITAWELNLSCPNTSAGGIEFGADPVCVRQIIEQCRARTSLPLIAKLSPVLPDIARVALVARDAGADGIAVVNTVPGSLTWEDGRQRLGNGAGGVSGPALLAIGVRAVSRVLERTGGMPVIGVGGVTTASDARQYLRAGASLVAIGTAALADPRVPGRVIDYLERHGV